MAAWRWRHPDRTGEMWTCTVGTTEFSLAREPEAGAVGANQEIDSQSGNKVWESSKDLAGLLLEDPTLVRGRTVLELGCGHGLPSLAAAHAGAASLALQDASAAVLRFFFSPFSHMCCLQTTLLFNLDTVHSFSFSRFSALFIVFASGAFVKTIR